MGKIRILGAGQGDLYQAATPETLAAQHELWTADMRALGGFVPECGPMGIAWTRDSGCPGDVLVCGPCGSTMDVAHEVWRAGRLRPWDSILTPAQSSGRGQVRRPWLSAPGNVFATVVCPPAPEPWNEMRSLVLGYLFAVALESLFGPVRIKWPNDLLMQDRKVGGMLVEERGDCILAGIGLNLVWAPGAQELREGHVVPAGMIPGVSVGMGPLRLWLSLVNQLETSYTTLLGSHSIADFLTLFRSRLAWAGKRVRVQEGAQIRYTATIAGVSGRGELVLDRDGEEVLLVSGDVIPL